jgi:DNA-binding transcriptional regulator YbjK
VSVEEVTEASGADGTRVKRPRRRAPAPVRRPRRTDPDRRGRIAQAALRVALERGVNAVSHRTVAAAADVPLGSTTYHFTDLDDLLGAALELAAARYAEQLVRWSAAIAPGGDIADALCDLVLASLERDAPRVAAEYELYLAALRRPALRDVSRAWFDLLPLVLQQHVDAVTARELAIAIDGLMINALVTGELPRRPDLYELLQKVVGELV